MKRELLIGVYTRVKAFVKWIKKNVKDGFCNKKQQKRKLRENTRKERRKEGGVRGQK